jgi:hypothetical protein
MGCSQMVELWVVLALYKVARGSPGMTYHISTKTTPITLGFGASVPSIGAN